MTDEIPPSGTPEATRKKNAAWVRTAVDYGAPIAFAVAFFATKNFQTATWVLVAASALALALGYLVERRVALLPLFSGVMALIFGTLGLVFHSDVFVKIKVTVVNGALAAFMIGGTLMGRAPLKALMGEAVHLPTPPGARSPCGTEPISRSRRSPTRRSSRSPTACPRWRAMTCG